MEKIKILENINDDILKLRKEVFVDEQGFSMDDEIEKDESIYTHCCLYKNNILIAYARYIKEDDHYHVFRVVVKKEYRNKNYGRKIMQIVENDIKKDKSTKLILNAQIQVVPFYEKIGYKKASEIFLECGYPHIKMEKII